MLRFTPANRSPFAYARRVRGLSALPVCCEPFSRNRSLSLWHPQQLFRFFRVTGYSYWPSECQRSSVVRQNSPSSRCGVRTSLSCLNSCCYLNCCRKFVNKKIASGLIINCKSYTVYGIIIAIVRFLFACISTNQRAYCLQV